MQLSKNILWSKGLTCALSAKKCRLIETVLLSTHSIIMLKLIFNYAPLSGGLEYRPQC